MDKIKKCEICKEYASKICLNCLNYYCHNCNKFVHDKKENQNHKIEKIDYFVPIDTKCIEHPKYPLDYFCLNEKGKEIFLYNFPIELCCANCIIKNSHKNHKLLEIFDEESLKKENLDLELSSKGFNEILQKVINLKDKIEKEINKINELYDKINIEVTKSFEIKHEKLIKEENDLKEKLQNEVTKVKEKLENYLTESNQIIKMNEKINKGIQSLEKKDKNMIINLSYISKMNKNNREAKILLQTSMENIKISFKEEESKIIYDKYIFNGNEYHKIAYFLVNEENIIIKKNDLDISDDSDKSLLKKDALKGNRILFVMLWSKTLNPEKENEYIHKDYIMKRSPESKACLKDALDYLGITIDLVENYRDAIEKLTIKNKDGNCLYYACWIINGPPYEILPDNSKEAFLLGQFLEVLKIFWENGGSLIFLADGWKLQYQTNEFLKMLEFEGKKIDFYLVGDDEEKNTKEHIGGKYLTADRTGQLKQKQLFSKKIEIYGGIQRLRLDHNLFTLYEGDTLCYTNTDDYEKLLPFHPFSRDSDNGISSLFYLADEKGRGDIFIDCGFSKLFINMDDSTFRYFQNIYHGVQDQKFI